MVNNDRSFKLLRFRDDSVGGTTCTSNTVQCTKRSYVPGRQPLVWSVLSCAISAPFSEVPLPCEHLRQCCITVLQHIALPRESIFKFHSQLHFSSPDRELRPNFLDLRAWPRQHQVEPACQISFESCCPESTHTHTHTHVILKLYTDHQSDRQ